MKPAWNYNPDPVNGRITLYTPKSYQVFANHPRFSDAFEAYRTNDAEGFINIADPTAYIKSLYAKYESIEVRDGSVFVDGVTINNLVAEHILDFLSKGLDCFPIFKFQKSVSQRFQNLKVQKGFYCTSSPVSHAANLSILKTGKARAIRFSTLEMICKVLDCQPGDIMEYVNEK